MPYVKRDENGKIIAFLDEPDEENDEYLASSSSELTNLLGASGEESIRAFLKSTDTDLIRVLEDLINLLIEERIIVFTDLPENAQRKLLNRRQAREHLTTSDSPVIDSEDII